MASYVFKNNSSSTVSDNPLDAGSTTLNVADGDHFPSTFPYKLTIWDDVSYSNPGLDPGMEIVNCIGRTANALTIVRDQEGTGDVQHTSGERVAMLITAGHFDDAVTGIVTKLDTIEEGSDVTDAVNVASSIVGVDAKSTPVGADSIAIIDSEDSNSLKGTTIAELAAVVGGSSTKYVQLFASGASLATDNAAQYPAAHGYTAATDGHPESFTLDYDDSRKERGNWDTELPVVPATCIIRVHYRGSGDAGNVMWAAGFIGIDDNEDSITPTEPTIVNFGAEDTVTADTNHRIASTTHIFAGSVATLKNCRCSVERVPSSESDSMVGDAKLMYVVIEYDEA